MTEDLVPRDDARAALEARRELGPAYEDELAERFAEQIEQRVEKRLALKRPADQGTAIVIISLITAIPLLGIAAGTVGLAGIIAVCTPLVLVNWIARN